MAQPPIRRQRLVAELRRERERRELSVQEAAERVGWDPTKLSRIENMRIGITGDDTLDLCEALGVEEARANALARLARESRRRGWWHSYNDVLGDFGGLLELDLDAESLKEWEADVIPGALQTRDYARAVISSTWPDSPPEEIEKRVDLRMERQERLHNTRHLKLWCTIDEAALMRPVGGRETMADQLDRLAERARQPGVTVQVLPIDISGHPSMGAPFTVIDLADGATYVYVDTLSGGLYLEEPSDIAMYTTTMERLQAQALDFDRSVQMIKRYAAQQRTGP
ncbi:helix-turn-helix transcriptional regulator [Haloechinothrix sp. LS1_15]|uniref:helix-turn-helix domain-containing protein n=1 Tax=Haloechinothrix sp. LS1_15 TaxID=2652248 RepID=UPI0029448CF4|nr:helix-turn-helix transcriptional regulator [Haloechinothrix sp. LS1_15]MDV6010983.1 helix-turn-helix transcriptional regulator [Haloechinothrix sp. LS1_15]